MKKDNFVFLLAILNLCILNLVAQVKIAKVQNKTTLTYVVDKNLLKT